MSVISVLKEFSISLNPPPPTHTHTHTHTHAHTHTHTHRVIDPNTTERTTRESDRGDDDRAECRNAHWDPAPVECPLQEVQGRFHEVKKIKRSLKKFYISLKLFFYFI